MISTDAHSCDWIKSIPIHHPISSSYYGPSCLHILPANAYYLIESQHMWLCFLQEFYHWEAKLSCQTLSPMDTYLHWHQSTSEHGGLVWLGYDVVKLAAEEDSAWRLWLFQMYKVLLLWFMLLKTYFFFLNSFHVDLLFLQLPDPEACYIFIFRRALHTSGELHIGFSETKSLIYFHLLLETSYIIYIQLNLTNICHIKISMKFNYFLEI
jgi:hypothetical protein